MHVTLYLYFFFSKSIVVLISSGITKTSFPSFKYETTHKVSYEIVEGSKTVKVPEFKVAKSMINFLNSNFY